MLFFCRIHPVRAALLAPPSAHPTTAYADLSHVHRAVIWTVARTLGGALAFGTLTFRLR
jgi:hypothetical protein